MGTEKVVTGKKTRAVIFSNGVYANPPGVLARLKESDWLVCADGALKSMVALGLWPDLLVGDFDSVEPDLLAEAKRRGVKLHAFAKDKDYTDTELAWHAVCEAGYRDVLLAGAFGGRWDHSFANLLLMAPYAQTSCRIAFTDGSLDAWLVTKCWEKEISRDHLVSILSLTPWSRGVTAHGFQWPLEDAELAWGQSLGISNVPTDDKVKVTVQEGLLLIVVIPKNVA